VSQEDFFAGAKRFSHKSLDTIYETGWRWKLALPDSNHPPTLAPEFAGYFQIAFHVFPYFVAPKRCGRFGSAIAFRTSVPKATVHEHGHSRFRKSEVWFSKE